VAEASTPQPLRSEASRGHAAMAPQIREWRLRLRVLTEKCEKHGR
jgi:hypothetical protein